MRSVVLEPGKTNVCGICGAKEPFIEYKELEGIHFIWCNKCHTISFFKPPQNEMKKHLIGRLIIFFVGRKNSVKIIELKPLFCRMPKKVNGGKP